MADNTEDKQAQPQEVGPMQVANIIAQGLLKECFDERMEPLEKSIEARHIGGDAISVAERIALVHALAQLAEVGDQRALIVAELQQQPILERPSGLVTAHGTLREKG